MKDLSFIVLVYRDLLKRSVLTILSSVVVGFLVGVVVLIVGGGVVGFVLGVLLGVPLFALLLQLSIHTLNNVNSIRKNAARIQALEKEVVALRRLAEETGERSEYNYKALELALLSEFGDAGSDRPPLGAASTESRARAAETG
jgi:hypothetical protein